MQFDVAPSEEDAASTAVTQTVFFEPKGLWGTIYWNLIALPHRLLFSGMLDALGRRIEATAAQPASPDAPPRQPAGQVS
jgi:hypothetical protein